MDFTYLQAVLSFLETAFGLTAILAGAFAERRKAPSLQKTRTTERQSGRVKAASESP